MTTAPEQLREVVRGAPGGPAPGRGEPGCFSWSGVPCPGAPDAEHTHTGPTPGTQQGLNQKQLLGSSSPADHPPINSHPYLGLCLLICTMELMQPGFSDPEHGHIHFRATDRFCYPSRKPGSEDGPPEHPPRSSGERGRGAGLGESRSRGLPQTSGREPPLGPQTTAHRLPLQRPESSAPGGAAGRGFLPLDCRLSSRRRTAPPQHTHPK